MKNSILINNYEVLGFIIDGQSRCKHYHSALDIIALKFKCCGGYYPCYECHQESVGHAAEKWTITEHDKKAVLCGVCGYELTIAEYLKSESRCPHCRASFNPQCSLHYNLYFEV